MCLYLVSSSDQIGSHLFSCFTIIQSDFYSAISFASSEEVIVRYFRRYNMLHIGSLLNLDVIAVFWQTSQIYINDVLLLASWLIIIFQGIMTSE